MKSSQRQNYSYTARFCEENIWWLVRSLMHEGADIKPMYVLFFSNKEKSILVTNQRAAEAGRPILWDYHVVLQADIEARQWIFDFDTRLAFPEDLIIYRQKTFPQQAVIPAQYRTWVRSIPAALYVTRFYSDRSHMQGLISSDKFPPYPIIQPADGEQRILLSELWDMQKQIEGTEVKPLDRL